MALILVFGLNIALPYPVLALSNERGSDPSGKSQRYVIENAPWYDPTACPSNTANITQTAGNTQQGKTYIIGDSITAEVQLQEKLKTALSGSGFNPIDINSLASRSLTKGPNPLNGITILQNDKAKWQDAKTIVVELGTNGGVSDGSIQETIDLIKGGNPTANIYWINVGADNSQRSTPIDTAAIANLLSKNANRGYQVIDWKTVVDANPNYIFNDGLGVHPYTEEGRNAYVDAILESLNAGPTNPSVAVQSGCVCSAGVVNSGFKGSNNVEIAFNFFNGRQGINSAQAAGIVGNFMRESGPNLDPNALNSIGAYGIAQWLGGRKDRLIEYARTKGKEANDLGLQLEFALEELNTTENKSLLELLKTTTPQEAAISFEENFERSEDVVGGDGMNDRINNANNVFARYGGNAAVGYSINDCQNAPGSLGQSPDGFVFPLRTTKTQIKKGNESRPGLIWCFNKQVTCHGDYPAADIGVPEGTEVVAAIGGKVINVDQSCPKDCSVVIKGTDGNVYFYDHMKSETIAVTENATVKPGDTLGKIGNAQDANNTSPHLHFSLMNSKWDYYPACMRGKNKCPNQNDMIDPQPWLVAAYKFLPE